VTGEFLQHAVSEREMKKRLLRNCSLTIAVSLQTSFALSIEVGMSPRLCRASLSQPEGAKAQPVHSGNTVARVSVKVGHCEYEEQLPDSTTR
jgi:hypothetical protein